MGHPQKGPLWDQNRQPNVKKTTVFAYYGFGRGGCPKMVLILHCAILHFGTHAMASGEHGQVICLGVPSPARQASGRGAGERGAKRRLREDGKTATCSPLAEDGHVGASYPLTTQETAGGAEAWPQMARAPRQAAW